MANLLPNMECRRPSDGQKSLLINSSDKMASSVATADFTLPKNWNNGYTVHSTLTMKDSQ